MAVSGFELCSLELQCFGTLLNVHPIELRATFVEAGFRCPSNVACNSPTFLSNLEIRSLELQRFQASLKLHPIELHASFLRGGRIDTCWCRSACPQTMRAVV